VGLADDASLGDLRRACREAGPGARFRLTTGREEQVLVADPGTAATLEWTDVVPGNIVLSEALPDGYDTPVVRCGVASIGDDPRFGSVDIDGDTLETAIAAGEVLVCWWFNVPSPTQSGSGQIVPVESVVADDDSSTVGSGSEADVPSYDPTPDDGEGGTGSEPERALVSLDLTAAACPLGFNSQGMSFADAGPACAEPMPAELYVVDGSGNRQLVEVNERDQRDAITVTDLTPGEIRILPASDVDPTPVVFCAVSEAGSPDPEFDTFAEIIPDSEGWYSVEVAEGKQLSCAVMFLQEGKP
jgi:hypothetical protein